MPVVGDGPYGQVAAEEAVMAQRSSDPVSTTGPEAAPGRGRLGGGLVAALAGVGLIAVLMAQNTHDVTLHVLFWSFTCPLWVFTPVVAVLGAVVWIGLGVLRRHRRRVARRADRAD